MRSIWRKELRENERETTKKFEEERKKKEDG